MVHKACLGKELERRRGGFSLIEIMITVMILGIGLVMVAGAFPVGLRYFSDSVDATTAAMLARSIISRLQAGRTAQYQGSTDPSNPIISRYAQVAIDECFEEGSSAVQYLFETSDGRHTDADGRPGELLADQGMGKDIDVWFVEAERISGMDERFGCQVFYQQIRHPLTSSGGRAACYQVFVVVQKSPLRTVADTSWAERFEAPSAPRTVTVDGTKVTWPAGFNVRPGAVLVDLQTADWYKVIEVNGDELTLNRAGGAVGTHPVRAINDTVGVFRAVVAKGSIR